jgi:hypothetical protein
MNIVQLTGILGLDGVLTQSVLMLSYRRKFWIQSLLLWHSLSVTGEAQIAARDIRGFQESQLQIQTWWPTGYSQLDCTSHTIKQWMVKLKISFQESLLGNEEINQQSTCWQLFQLSNVHFNNTCKMQQMSRYRMVVYKMRITWQGGSIQNTL